MNSIIGKTIALIIYKMREFGYGREFEWVDRSIGLE